MCDRCVPRITRRDALLLGGGAIAGVSLSGWRSPARVEALAATAVPVTDRLTVQPRSVWAGSDRNPTGPIGAEDVRFLLVHHTASPNGAEPIGTMRGIYNFHTGPDKAWPDVAYNFFIDEAGVVYEARTGSLAGPVEASATGGSQGFAQLVCLLGDFTSQNPTEAALASLTLTLGWLGERYGVDTTPGSTVNIESRGSNRWPAGEVVAADTVSGHRDMSQTACPGDTFYPALKSQIWPAAHQARLDAASSPATTSNTTTSNTTPSDTTATSTTASDTTGAESDAPSSSGSSDTTQGVDSDVARTSVPAAPTEPETSSPDGVLPMPDAEAANDDDGPELESVAVVGGAVVATGALAAAWRARRNSRTW